MTRYMVTMAAHPWSVNEQVRWHHQQRARQIRTWRQAFYMLTLQARVPRMEAAALHVRTTVAPPARLHDCGNEFYAVKAAVDGMVDAGVLADDSPQHLRSITFHAPVRGAQHAMQVMVEAVPAPRPPGQRQQGSPRLVDAVADGLLDDPQVRLSIMEARVLLGLLRVAPLTDPHHQQVAADLAARLTAQGVR